MYKEVTPRAHSERSNKRLESREARFGSHLAHSIDMLGALPSLREKTQDGYVSCACTESWMLHVRILAEFLAPGPLNLSKDFTCKTFEWSGLQSEDAAFLNDLKDLASTYLVHLGTQRFPDDVADLDPKAVSYIYMTDISLRVLRILDAFIDHLGALDNDAYHILQTSVFMARTKLDIAD